VQIISLVTVKYGSLVIGKGVPFVSPACCNKLVVFWLAFSCRCTQGCNDGPPGDLLVNKAAGANHLFLVGS
jgi:hypothetical protein